MTRHDRTWTTQPEAAALVAATLDGALAAVPEAQALTMRLRNDIGVRLIDILDYISLPDGSDVSPFVDAGWEPDLAGSSRAAVAAAGADRDAAVATLADTQVRVAAETALAWIELRSLQARLAIARRTLASQEHTLHIALWRAEAGLVTRLDVEQARSSVEQTRAQIPALEGAAERSANALAVLTGDPPGTLASLLAEAAPLPAPQRGDGSA